MCTHMNWGDIYVSMQKKVEECHSWQPKSYIDISTMLHKKKLLGLNFEQNF